jgi:tetratricopeptide (TPR) repeat protein
MKTMVVIFLLFFSAANVEAQGRHRSVPSPNLVSDGINGDLFSAPPTHLLDSEAVPTPAPAAGHGANPVPVSQLRIPAKAVKEFERAQKAFQSGDIPTSEEHLQKAVQIYPDFIEAHNALGLRLIQTGEFQKALAEHEIALSLNPRNAQTHADLSLALLSLNRFQEAEREARRALELDSEPVAPRYFLARALIGQSHITPEVMQMLRESEGVFANASLVLAQIHFAAGQTDQVIAHLQRYLQKPEDPDNRQKAVCWVAQLSQQPIPAGCPAGVTRPSFR